MAAPNTTPPPFVLAISSWLPDGGGDEFDEWCDVHHRGLLTVPGVRRARRFTIRRGSSGDAPDVLVTYDLDDPTIVGTDLWRVRGGAAGPLPVNIAAGLRATTRTLAVAAALPAQWWPPARSTLLDVFTIADARRADALVAGMQGMAPDDAPVAIVRVLRADDAPALVFVDHSEEDGHDAIDLLTDASGANRTRWSVVFDEGPSEDGRTAP